MPSLLLLALLFPVADQAPQAGPSKEQIGRWVQELGDNDFETRERATRKLWEAGRAAEPALADAARSDDPEVTQRAQQILSRFRWGLYPDTPPRIAALVSRYRSTDDAAKLALIKEYYDQGGAGWGALLRIARGETDAALRERLRQQITQDINRALPSLLADGALSTLDELVELLAVVQRDTDSAYAAHLLARGRLDEAIARLRTEAERPTATRERERLAFLLRARGDRAGARAAAEKTDNRDLQEAVLVEQGDWKALAARRAPPTTTSGGAIEAWGLRAAYQRLAGDSKGLEASLAELRRLLPASANDDDRWRVAKALFANARPDDALAILGKGPGKTAVLFEVLCARLAYREALALPDTLPAGSPERPALELLRAEALYGLGEKEKARTAFASLAAQIRNDQETQIEVSLVETEARLGLKALAREHALRILAGKRSPGHLEMVFGALFPDRGRAAAAWWHYLYDRHAGEEIEAMFQRLTDILEHKVSEKELEAQAREAAGWPNLLGEEREAILLGAAEVARAAGWKKATGDYLRQAADAGRAAWPLLRLGDELAADKQWDEAARMYADAWARDTSDPVPLYLRGHALIQAGKTEEGKKWQEAAFLLPLGREGVRYAFAGAMAKRGHREAAQRSRHILLRTGAPRSFYAGEVLREAALEAYDRADFLRGAERHEIAVLRLLGGANFLDNGAYVSVPQMIQRYRARGLLAAGRIDEARQTIAVCRKLLPAEIELPILVLPEMEKRGLTKEATELFDSTFAAYEALCRAYPNCAWAHNAAAWLSAGCRRRLDDALTHALKATELAPDSASYHDTLGEVYFQRGDRAKAREHARKSIALAPGKAYYRRQLARIEAGDPKAELPPQGDH